MIGGGGHSLAAKLREHLAASGKSVYQLSRDSGVDATYLWRILRGERLEVSREVLILVSTALTADAERVDEFTFIANELLDAAGYRMLRDRRTETRIEDAETGTAV